MPTILGNYEEIPMSGLWDTLKSTASKTVSSITGQATTTASKAVTQATTAATQAAQTSVQKAQESVVTQSNLLTNKALTSVGLQPSTPKPQPSASAPANVVSTGTNVNVAEIAASVPMTTTKKAALSVGAMVGIGIAGFLFWKFVLNKKG